MEIRCITGGKCNICVSNFLSEMRDFVCVSRTNLCAYLREMLMWNCDEDVEISTANQSEREGGDNIISPSVRVMTRQMHVSKVKKKKKK